MTEQYFSECNSNNPDQLMNAPEGVSYIFAAKKQKNLDII